MCYSKLYGDGIHDDAPIIQELLNTGICEVYLPAPKVSYLIGTTLKIHSNQTLRTSPYTIIKLADGASCAMLECADFGTQDENITVEGGVWDMNNENQAPNPWHFPGEDGLTARDRLKNENLTFADLTEPPSFYTGMCMRFCDVKNLQLRGITLKNPVTYGIQLYKTENFTVRDITFDYTTGAPKLWNMDGIHVEGYCKNGYINNLKGACHDDLVAITADDMLYGPVSNIVVDGVFAEGCHSGVRLLSKGLPLENVSIRNVSGSYYTYCISLTKYYGGEGVGVMKNISIDGISACASVGTKDVAGGNFPFIWVESGLDIDMLRIENVMRRESTYPTPTVKIDSGAVIDRLIMNNIITENLTGKDFTPIVIEGKIGEKLEKI